MLLKHFPIEPAGCHPHAVVSGLNPGTVDTGLSEPFQKGVAPDRLFSPVFSAERMLTVLDDLTPADSGGVFAWDGARVPE